MQRVATDGLTQLHSWRLRPNRAKNQQKPLNLASPTDLPRSPGLRLPGLPRIGQGFRALARRWQRFELAISGPTTQMISRPPVRVPYLMTKEIRIPAAIDHRARIGQRDERLRRASYGVDPGKPPIGGPAVGTAKTDIGRVKKFYTDERVRPELRRRALRGLERLEHCTRAKGCCERQRSRSFERQLATG
jgi:hypothetical protein